ncbi:MAG: copper resistance CopC family protein [Acidobacteriaceae bacterium]|jgi:copper resistance protein C
MSKRLLTLALCLFGLLLLTPRLALAHAHLMSSTPAANATVRGPQVSFELRYNSRVDGQHSVLILVMPDNRTETLTLDRQSAATNLNTHATLHPGHYTIRWQALSTDGHLTRGEIPFTVR